MCCQRSKVTLRTGYKWEPVFRDLILEHAENLCSLTSPENDDVSMIMQAASFSISKSPTIYIKCVHAYTCRYECLHKTRYSVCVKICCVHSFFNDFNGDTSFEGTASSVKAFYRKSVPLSLKNIKAIAQERHIPDERRLKRNDNQMYWVTWIRSCEGETQFIACRKNK